MADEEEEHGRSDTLPAIEIPPWVGRARAATGRLDPAPTLGALILASSLTGLVAVYVASVYCRQYTVVRSHEILTTAGEGNISPFTADARIDHDEVYRTGRETTGCGIDNQSCSRDVLRRNAMGDIDQRRNAIDAEDHPLHHTHEKILNAEVGRQSDDAVGRWVHGTRIKYMVGRPGLEPGTPCLKGRCSTD